MILLTDGEIERRLGKFLDAHPHAQWDSDMAFRDMCKAQLKKVVEWLKERADYEHENCDDACSQRGGTTIRIHPEDWQALLKEIE